MAETDIDLDSTPRTYSWRSCVVALTVILLIGLLPLFGCRLITQGVLQFGDEQGRFLNIFMLQEPDREGIGVQWTRSFDAEAQCTRTTVRYYMFVGEGENLNFCECTQQPVSRPLSDMCLLSE